MRVLFNVLIGGVLVYVGLALYLYLFQSHMIYFPDLLDGEVTSSPADVGLAFEALQLMTVDGETLDGWYVPAPKPRATVLFLHGNGGNIGHRVEMIQLFHQLGLSVMVFDYRGYGRSTGKPSEDGTYRDAEAVWRYLTETRNIPPSEIVVYGESLGGAIAAWLARRHPPRAMLLYASFTSLPDMAEAHYPWLPARWLTRFQYDTRAALAAVHCPVLILHGVQDEIVPYHQGQELLAVAPGPKRLVALQGGHNDAILISREIVVRAIGMFLQTNGSPRQ